MQNEEGKEAGKNKTVHVIGIGVVHIDVDVQLRM